MKNLLILLAVFLLPLSGMAHKMRVFASNEGDSIKGYVYMSGGARASVVSIELLKDGKMILSDKTAQDGTFSFKISGSGDYQIKADSGDGHAAESTVKILSSGTQDNEISKESAVQSLPASSGISNDELKKEIAAQINPVLEKLEEMEERTRFRDILGGFGWILGIAGISAWFMSRKKKD